MGPLQALLYVCEPAAWVQVYTMSPSQSQRYLNVQGWQIIPKGPRLAKSTKRSKVSKEYLVVQALGGGGETHARRKFSIHNK